MRYITYDFKQRVKVVGKTFPILFLHLLLVPQRLADRDSFFKPAMRMSKTRVNINRSSSTIPENGRGYCDLAMLGDVVDGNVFVPAHMLGGKR